MARPARPERSRSALPLRQLSRFCYLINSDMVFGTHRPFRQGAIYLEQTSLRFAQAVQKIRHGLMQCSKKDRYSITSSARASSVGGIVRPRMLAVLRLTTVVTCLLDRSVSRRA